MEGGTLFNSGFLGGSFLWWIGQIADDSAWRDNILPGKFENKDSVPGWGRRYKVRIVGLHDQEEETIPSDQLPWAQVMYPVTGGGGQTNASQTANLRQGMFVFGFFLDGQDQQVPVIMGVLGNNAQTALGTRTGMTGGKNFSPQSGFARNVVEKEGTAKEKVPDEGLVTTKPKSPTQARECSPPPPGVTLNANGLRPDIALSQQQFSDSQSARAEADAQGLTGAARDNFIQQKVAEGIKNRCQEANSPGSPSQPGATKENVDAVHELSAGDVKLENKLREPIALLKADNIVESAAKAIQTVLNALTEKLNTYLNAISSYIDAVSSKIRDIQNLIANAACEIAKYMKILLDKIMEYVMKIINKALTKVVASLPSSMRAMFADMKEIITELILCLYGKLTGQLCGIIQKILDSTLNIGEAERKARANTNNPQSVRTRPKVPPCYAEDIIGQTLYASKGEIEKANNTLLNNINAFLDDIQSQLAGVSGALSDIQSLLGGITGSMTGALQFENIKLNVFGCEIKPNPAVSDFYTFARGGAGQPDSSLPSNKAIENRTNREPSTPVGAATETPYAEPPTTEPDRDLRN
jgi:hypothetical protein